MYTYEGRRSLTFALKRIKKILNWLHVKQFHNLQTLQKNNNTHNFILLTFIRKKTTYKH